VGKHFPCRFPLFEFDSLHLDRFLLKSESRNVSEFVKMEPNALEHQHKATPGHGSEGNTYKNWSSLCSRTAPIENLLHFHYLKA
jgi:hypothetical protein